MSSEIKLLAGTKVYYCFNSKGDNFKVNQLLDAAKNKLYVRDKMSCTILMGDRWLLKMRVKILGLLLILLGNADFVILMKAQITRKKINLPKLFFVN